MGEAHSLLFIQGYNNSFEQSALRAAQLGFDLKVKGVTAFFSWPSKAKIRGYAADAATIVASEVAITKFLADSARVCGSGRVHIIAHSMGNRGLLRSLQRLADNAQRRSGVRCGQIFLAAPDMDRDLFISLARLYPQFSQRTTLYASNGDRAVSTSAWLHSFPRAGYLPPATVVKGISNFDTIAVPGFDLDLLGHSFFAEAEAVLYDMGGLMHCDSDPGSRPRIDGKKHKDGYFIMRK